MTGYHNFFGFYTLTNMHANITSGIADITVGVATYNMTKADKNLNCSPTSMNMTGKIEFLGNHTAKVTIDPNHLYLVNLLTGTVTAI